MRKAVAVVPRLLVVIVGLSRQELFEQLIGFCEAGMNATLEEASSMKVGA